MPEQTIPNQRYKVSVYESEGAEKDLVFTFIPGQHAIEHCPDSTQKRPPQFIVAVHHEDGGLAFDWSRTLDDPEAARIEIQAEISARMKDREIWLDRVNSLVREVEQWASEMGWSTRRVEKKLEDARIGKHAVPALLMQEETCRVLLEPVGRSTPGAEGVAELYLMPAYDDIASLYFYANHWNLHYQFSDSEAVATVRETEAMPLSKEVLERVLAEMKQNAA